MTNETNQANTPGSVRQTSWVLGAALGGLTSLAFIGISYLGSKLVDLPFLPFDLFDWLARVLPGNIIITTIDTMVNLITSLGLGPISGTAKGFEQTSGILIVVGAGVVLGVVTTLALRRTAWSGGTIGAAFGILGFLIATGVELSLGSAVSGNVLGSLLWLAVLIVGWCALLGSWLGAPQLTAAPAPATDEFRSSRRTFLTKVAGGSIGVAVVASGLGKLFDMQIQATGAGQSLSTLQGRSGAVPIPDSGAAPTTAPFPTPPADATAQATLRDRIAAAPGTRPELTSNKDFYRIDIDTLPVIVDKSSWKLAISGLFDHPRDLVLADLVAYAAVTQPITQSCISNPVAGDLIGTTNYTGARLRDVLKDLGLRSTATSLYIQSADGFYETVIMEDMMDPRTLLVYGMNGDTLPVEHGYPLRIYIPNRYGMKQPKWITSIQATDQNGPGYWVDRGWSPTAYPQIVSVIDTVAKDNVQNGRVPIGGIAWAGDRGIKKVELQVDGAGWTEAQLRTPPLSALTWVQWRYDWPLAKGSHTFTVRATDGTGALQTAQVQDTYPVGATGYHSLTVNL
ncbi:MAG: molybdopterin-dependent oxidoreductase [Chloroflexi bacterium]|nr:molybdopterin-dependent oxidoreductase [Chloroflexota bacterium]